MWCTTRSHGYAPNPLGVGAPQRSATMRCTGMLGLSGMYQRLLPSSSLGRSSTDRCKRSENVLTIFNFPVTTLTVSVCDGGANSTIRRENLTINIFVLCFSLALYELRLKSQTSEYPARLGSSELFPLNLPINCAFEMAAVTFVFFSAEYMWQRIVVNAVEGRWIRK